MGMESNHYFDAQNFGAIVRARRKALRLPQAAVPGGPSSTYMSKIERGHFAPFSAEIIDKLAEGLNWDRANLRQVIDGEAPLDSLPIDQPEAVRAEDTPRSFFERLSNAAEDAQVEFQRAASDLAAAEARVDALNHRVFSFLALEEHVRESIAMRERDLGRPLTERELAGLAPRNTAVTADEIVRGVEGWASNDAHERTRYEMALMVEVGGWTMEDATAGSRFADFQHAFERARAFRHLREEDDELLRSFSERSVSYLPSSVEPSAAEPKRRDVEGDAEPSDP